MIQPENPSLLPELAEKAYFDKDYVSAEKYLKEALIYYPDNVELYNNLGLLLHAAGRLDEAIRHFRKAIEIKPELADLHYNLGNVLKDKKQFDEAVSAYQKAVRCNPDLDEAYTNLGFIFHEKGMFNEAIAYYQKALDLKKGDAEAFFNLGRALQSNKQYDRAATSYSRAISVNPSLHEAYNNLGLVLQELGNPGEAIRNYRKAIRIKPDFANAHYNLGTVLHKQKELVEAIIHYQNALEINPAIDDAYFNLGMALQTEGRLDDALLAYRRASQFAPNSTDVLLNLGIVLHEKQRLDEAMSTYRRVLELDPGNAEAHWNLAISLLLSGNFEEGWREYEWRLRVKQFEKRNFSQPRWDGSEIRNRRIMLHAEQGIGDTLHFIRYARLVAEKGAKVIVECQKALVSLLKDVEGVENVLERGSPLPHFDLHCPLPSLPYVFHTILDTIPAEIPYIKVDAEEKAKWAERIHNDPWGVRVGLVWAGSPAYPDDRLRSCALERFQPLVELDGVTFYSLQKGTPAEQLRETGRFMKIVDHMDEVHDFSDTAAFIENLDLVISVDTAAAHLGGALGKPVWTLLPFSPDWRWMLHRADTPWYPAMRLFRQPSPGDWKTVIERVSEELKFLIKEKKDNN